MKNLEQAKAAVAKVEKLKGELAKKRDELRAAVADVNEIIETLDHGVEEIEIGLKYLTDALDDISQLV